MVCCSVPGWRICETAQRYRNQSSHPDGKEQPPRFHPRMTKKVNEGFYRVSVISASQSLSCLPSLTALRETHWCVCVSVCVPGSWLHWECVSSGL